MSQIIKQKLLHHSIPNIYKYGWTNQTVRQTCKSLGYPQAAVGHVRNVPFELVDYFQHWALQQSIQDYQSHSSSSGNIVVAPEAAAAKDKEAFYENVSKILHARLSKIVSISTRWHEAIGIMMSGGNALESVSLVKHISDQVVITAGDSSYNMTYYTRRAAVSTICGSTELFLVMDRSKGKEDTFKELQRLIDRAKDAESMGAEAEQYFRVCANSLLSVLP